MPLLHALVARGVVVLAEYSVVPGNAGVATRLLLSRLPPDGQRQVKFEQDRHMFHILQTGGLVFVCMADVAFGRRKPDAFLEQICAAFIKSYSREMLTAPEFAFQDEFERVLAEQMEFFSSNPNSDSISRLKEDVGKVREVMVENIDAALKRGERIELLVNKAANLQDQTFKFRKQARTLQQTLWMQNIKLYAILFAVGLAILLVVLASLCGGITLPVCRAVFDWHTPSSPPGVHLPPHNTPTSNEVTSHTSANTQRPSSLKSQPLTQSQSEVLSNPLSALLTPFRFLSHPNLSETTAPATTSGAESPSLLDLKPVSVIEPDARESQGGDGYNLPTKEKLVTSLAGRNGTGLLIASLSSSSSKSASSASTAGEGELLSNTAGGLLSVLRAF